MLLHVNGCDGQASTWIALNLLPILSQRLWENRNAVGDEIYFDDQVWFIFAAKMKIRRDHNVPRPAQPILLFDDLKRLSNEGEYLFSFLRIWTRPMFEKPLNAAPRRLGYSGSEMTAHGLRASCSTLANESGLWNPDAIERILAHVEQMSFDRTMR